MLREFGRALFGCAPENLPSLTPQQRAHCPAMARPDASAVIEPPSHVKDPARRAAEMAAKNTPGRIPCSFIMSAPAPFGATTPAPAVDPVCVLGGLLHGFKPLSGLAH